MECLQKNKVCPPENRAEGEPKLEKNPCENHARKSDAANMKKHEKGGPKWRQNPSKTIPKRGPKKDWFLEAPPAEPGGPLSPVNQPKSQQELR